MAKEFAQPVEVQFQELVGATKGMLFSDALSSIVNYDQQITEQFFTALKKIAHSARHRISHIDQYGNEITDSEIMELISEVLTKALSRNTVLERDILSYLKVSIDNIFRSQHAARKDQTDLTESVPEKVAPQFDREFSLEPQLAIQIIEHTYKRSLSQKILLLILFEQAAQEFPAYATAFEQALGASLQQLIDQGTGAESLQATYTPYSQTEDEHLFRQRQGKTKIIKQRFQQLGAEHGLYLRIDEAALKQLLHRSQVNLQKTHFLHRLLLELQGLGDEQIDKLLGEPSGADTQLVKNITLTFLGAQSVKQKHRIARNVPLTVAGLQELIAQHNTQHGTHIRMGQPYNYP